MQKLTSTACRCSERFGSLRTLPTPLLPTHRVALYMASSPRPSSYYLKCRAREAAGPPKKEALLTSSVSHASGRVASGQCPRTHLLLKPAGALSAAALRTATAGSQLSCPPSTPCPSALTLVRKWQRLHFPRCPRPLTRGAAQQQPGRGGEWSHWVSAARPRASPHSSQHACSPRSGLARLVARRSPPLRVAAACQRRREEPGRAFVGCRPEVRGTEAGHGALPRLGRGASRSEARSRKRRTGSCQRSSPQRFSSALLCDPTWAPSNGFRFRGDGRRRPEISDSGRREETAF